MLNKAPVLHVQTSIPMTKAMSNTVVIVKTKAVNTSNLIKDLFFLRMICNTVYSFHDSV